MSERAIAKGGVVFCLSVCLCLFVCPDWLRDLLTTYELELYGRQVQLLTK